LCSKGSSGESRVEFVDGLPRNPAGKILKKELRTPYREGRDRQVG
jgi:fatty-acyl-CoA synthase